MVDGKRCDDRPEERMSGAEVDRLLLCLPDDNAFNRALFPNERWRTATPGDRLRVGRWNPQLLWDMAQAHAQAGQPLPELDLPQDLRRAYAFLVDPNSSDESMALVHMLHLPDPLETLLEADLIDAALICEDLTQQAIADRFQYRSRSDPAGGSTVFQLPRPPLRGSLHRPDICREPTGQPWAATSSAWPTKLVIRTGFCPLPVSFVRRRSSLPPEILADEIERDLLRLAIAGLRKNLDSTRSVNPALALVEKYLLPLRQKAKAVEPLHGLQLHQEDLGVLYTELNERLALLRGNTKDVTSATS